MDGDDRPADSASGGAHEEREADLERRVAERTAALERELEERRLVEEALRESEARYRLLVEGAHDLIFQCDEEGRLLFVNAACAKAFGCARAALIGESLFSFVSEERRDAAREAFGALRGGGSVRDLELSCRARDGRAFCLLADFAAPALGHEVTYAGNARDITERRRAEEERRRWEAKVQQAQKLESLGVLAGGIAHDFNNLLVSILGGADLALRRLPEGSPVRRYLELVKVSGNRAAALTHQMLAYAGKGRCDVEPFQLNDLLREMSRLLRSALPCGGELRLELAPDLPWLRADRLQMRQVILNVVTNAAEALGEGPGVVTVRTLLRHADDDTCDAVRPGFALAPGQHVCLEVHDTGCGMDSATRARVFDPFYTTKFAGRGLGLAAVQGIIRAHDGGIAVESAAGEGSLFRLWLPALPGERPQRRAAIPSKEWQGAGTVLLVDDEEVVRVCVSQMLQELGFSVALAASGREAVECVRESLSANGAGRFRCVLLDLKMPHMDGVRTHEALRRLDAEVPVILCTGYGEEELLASFGAAGFAGFIQKPFSLDGLRDRLERALEGRPGDPPS